MSSIVGRRNLTQVSIEGRDMKNGFPTEIPLQEIVQREKTFRETVEHAVLGRLVQQRVAKVRFAHNDRWSEQCRRDLIQMTVGGGHVIDAVSRIAGQVEIFRGEQRCGQMGKLPAFRGVVQGRIAGVVAQGEVLGREEFSRNPVQAAITGKRVQGRGSRCVPASEVMIRKRVSRNCSQHAGAGSVVQIKGRHIVNRCHLHLIGPFLQSQSAKRLNRGFHLPSSEPTPPFENAAW